MSDRNFFAELKRRNVIRMAGLYLVGAWLLTQVASTVLPMFGAPEWLPRSVVSLLAIGFIPMLILSWVFELTPEGFKRDADVLPEQSIAPQTARRMDRMIIIVLVLALTYFAFDKFVLARRRVAEESRVWVPPNELATSINGKSIAVLPFDNLSEDKTNAYFATGIQDEILARLAKIADLRVISRTSTLQYQSRPTNLSEIAKQLGVAHVLEGSVQKAGDQVRVNVQLINAVNDAHVWAEIYDRKLTDIFAVESEIAKSVTQSLQAKLTGGEEQALAVKPTNNPEAYDAYLRGLASEGQSLHSVYAFEKAVGFYEQAVRSDPNFALAWSKLSRANAIVYASPNDPTDSRRDAAKRALDMAQKLQPDSPETQLALAYYQTAGLRDYELGKTTFRLVGKMLPGSSDVPVSLAYIAQRQGRWDETVAYFEQALVLNPRSPDLLVEAANHYSTLRRFEPALKLCDRALDILPNDLDVMAFKAAVYQGQGELSKAAELLSEVNAKTPSLVVFATKIIQLTLERNLSEAVRLLRARVADYNFGGELERGVFEGWLALTQRLAGDASARVTAEQARKTIEPVCKDQPDNDFAAAQLSRVYAILGDKKAALKEAERAGAGKPGVQYVENISGLEENLAMVQTILGDNSGAISNLSRILEVPYASTSGIYGTPITPALLKLDPLWDPLRADPAFRKLYEEKR